MVVTFAQVKYCDYPQKTSSWNLPFHKNHQ